MKSTSILVLLFAFIINLQAQINPTSLKKENYASYFEEAYQLYPAIPKGILEAVAYTHTHMRHIKPAQEAPSCIGLPASYGIMGLVADGQGYFKNNLNYIAQESRYTVEQIKNSARYQILAYAAVYHQSLQKFEIKQQSIAAQLPVLIHLSELPTGEESENRLFENYALQTQLYGILDFLNQKKYQSQYRFPARNIEMKAIFGEQNYRILSSPRVLMKDASIETEEGETFDERQLMSMDYPPAIWDPADNSNYGSRNGTAITAVTIHTIQGSYAGAISWFKNPVSNVSAHYVIRSSDGQVTQMVLEADRAFHVGNSNPFTIGFEHEGYVDDASWYTDAMYESSADIVRDIVDSGYGINPLRSYHGAACGGSSNTCQLGGCIKVKGHQHYPSQTHTDPGLNWDWIKYYNLINQDTPVTTEMTESGTACDSGGSIGSYGDDERTLFRISPPNAISITLDFTAFDLELNWDYLTIYEGGTVDDPVVGTYTGTNSPGNMTFYSESVLVEFRSDCATINPGYCFDWSAVTEDNIAPIVQIGSINDPVSEDFLLDFLDTDNSGGSGVNDTYFLVADYDGTEWRSNGEHGFYYDDFSAALHTDWTVYSGTWNVAGGQLVQSDVNDGNTNIYAAVDQNGADEYLYHWKGTISGSGTNQRAGIHVFCDDAHADNRNNSYFMYFREGSDLLQFYKVVNDTWTLEVDIPYVFNLDQAYDFKLFFNKITGLFDLYIDDVLAMTWTDVSPHTTGNYVSFRNGNCVYTIDDFRVQKRRSGSEMATVGEESTHMIRYQNPDMGTAAGSVRSIIRDHATNISSESVSFFNVNWTVLSVELLDFYATVQKDDIQLDWTLGAADNLLTYDLERSTDGMTFKKIAQLEANAWTFKYHYKDQEVALNQRYYYRLKMIEKDGRFSYSSVLSAEIKGAASVFEVYPNPAQHLLNITFFENTKHPTEENRFVLYDALGQMTKEWKITDKSMVLDVSTLPDGVYFGMMETAHRSVLYSKKVVIRP